LICVPSRPTEPDGSTLPVLLFVSCRSFSSARVTMENAPQFDMFCAIATTSCEAFANVTLAEEKERLCQSHVGKRLTRCRRDCAEHIKLRCIFHRRCDRKRLTGRCAIATTSCEAFANVTLAEEKERQDTKSRTGSVDPSGSVGREGTLRRTYQIAVHFPSQM
jgi:hypothetical protein